MTSPGKRALSPEVIALGLILIVAAAIPRLYNLGEQSFYMDEETTAFASRSLLEEGNAQMPSGMPYRRALPHTWLNSVSAEIFGAKNEFSYRLPGAIFGILTAPLIFFLARPYVGTSAAFLAGLLLAFSEWHIITSRQARMYAPFLFFYTACAFSFLQWARQYDFKTLVFSIFLFMITVSVHSLGVIAAFVPLVILAIKGYAKTSQYKIIIFSVVAGVTAYLYGELFVGAPYQFWKETHGITTESYAPSNALVELLIAHKLMSAQALFGLLSGIWLARVSRFSDTDNGKEFRIVTRYVLAMTFGLLSASGHIHGACLSMLLIMLLYPGSLLEYIKKTYKPLIVLIALGTYNIAVTFSDQGIVPGIKATLSFPFPYWPLLAEISPGIVVLFVSLLLLVAMRNKKPDDCAPIAMGICGLFPLIIVGIAMKWAPSRYLLVAYPFILISSAFMLHYLSARIAEYFSLRSPIPRMIAPFIIALPGFLGGHGMLQAYKSATIGHGDPLNQAASSFVFYPDHKYPGEFVAKNKQPGDIVVAEDVLVQKWYAGHVDYWLRNYDTDIAFMYKGKDRNLHDIYVDSVVATLDVLSSLNETGQRVWLITSGETYNNKDYYLADLQRSWLDDIEKTNTPVYVGKDNITKVYCLNCAADDFKQPNR